jgi:cold shock CspA family protein
MRGQVKALRGGYGFVRLDDGTDAFFLPTAVEPPGTFDQLQVEQAIEADVDMKAERGPRAVRVRVL